MTIYEALMLIDTAVYNKMGIRTGSILWTVTNDLEVAFGIYPNDDEFRMEFAYDLVNWANRGDDIKLVKDDSIGNEEEMSIEEAGISPALFEDEISLILDTFTEAGSVIKSIDMDGNTILNIELSENVDNYPANKYAKEIVCNIYDAIERSEFISITTPSKGLYDVDMLDLRKRVEY